MNQPRMELNSGQDAATRVSLGIHSEQPGATNPGSIPERARNTPRCSRWGSRTRSIPARAGNPSATTSRGESKWVQVRARVRFHSAFSR